MSFHQSSVLNVIYYSTVANRTEHFLWVSPFCFVLTEMCVIRFNNQSNQNFGTSHLPVYVKDLLDKEHIIM